MAELQESINLTGSNIVTGTASPGDERVLILVATGSGYLSGSVQTFSKGNNSSITGTLSVNGVFVSAGAMLGIDGVVSIPITTPTALEAGDVVQLELSGGVVVGTQLSATVSIT